MFRLSRVFIVLAVAAALAGCTSRAANELLTETAAAAAPDAIAGRHQIFVATTRARADDRLQVYGGGRAAQTDFARVDITVPARHEIGRIERRRGSKPDPSRYFTATDLSVYSEPAFAKALREDIARRDGRALVFIHGYRTAFDSSVYRTTQIVHDAKYSGTPILFSWASAGRTVDYVYDNNSATAARDALESTLRLVVAAGARRIDIIAHSMGNWVTMEALRQLSIAGDPTLSGRLGDVILASPDLDVDVFKAQMQRYGKPERPFIVMLSDDDRALRLAGVIAGDRPRVGDYANAADLVSYGVVVVDLSKVKGDRLGHTKFAANPLMIEMLGAGLNDTLGAPENERELTERVGELTGHLGRTLTSATEIVITTPINVMRIAVGQ